MIIERQIHKGYEEYKKLPDNIKGKVKQIFGKYHYFYSSKKGVISLVQLINYDFISNKDVWEIWELSANNLFEDTERFASKKDAEKRIKELLE